MTNSKSWHLAGHLENEQCGPWKTPHKDTWQAARWQSEIMRAVVGNASESSLWTVPLRDGAFQPQKEAVDH